MPSQNYRYQRKYLTEIALAFGVVSLCGTIWVSSYLMLKRPYAPDYAAEFVYPFSVKGPKVYISASDYNCFSLCWLFFILGLGCFAYRIGPRKKSTDVTANEDGSFSTGNKIEPSISGIALLISIILLGSGFLLLGRWTGDFLAAHGVLLQFFNRSVSGAE